MLNFLLKILLRVFVILIVVGFFLYWHKTPDKIVMDTYGIEMPKLEKDEVKELKPLIVQNDEDDKEVKIPDEIKVDNKVPFLVQAPSAQWNEERYQDACEEASMLMVNLWLSGKGTPSTKNTEKMLEDLFQAEKEYFKSDVLDTSITDTAKFMRDYYGYPVSVIENVSLFDLYNAIADGNIIIVPTDGRKLDNLNFSGGGPERHMLVITGYDLKNKEFITNDPGTRKGKNYRYKVNILYNAIRDYKTGHKEDINEINKNVIIIKKDS